MSTFTALGIVHPGVFCLAVVLLNLTPGPDTAFIVGQSVAHGRRIGLMSVLGISAGCVVHTIALALGLSALIAASAEAFLAVKIAGAFYLTFLGLRMIIATFRTRLGNESEQQQAGAIASARSRRPSKRRTFVQGFLTNVLNPKVVLFFLSFFPQFVSDASASKPSAFVMLGAMLIVISTIYNSLVAWVAGSITQRVRSAPRVKSWLDRAIGAAFVALGARLAFAEH